MKKIYLLAIVIIGLFSVLLYPSFAMFTQNVNIGEFVTITAGTLSTEANIAEYERITIESNTDKTVDLNITNSTSSSLYYGVWYEMIEPSTINSNIIIAKLDLSDNPIIGQLTSNQTKTVTLYLENNTNNDVIINIGVGYSSTASLNLPIGRTIITAEHGTQLDASGANKPKIVDGFVPIMYDEARSTWVKADIKHKNGNYKWYDYDQKKWANAVLIKETAYAEDISQTNKSVSINNDLTGIKKYTSSNQGKQSTSSINTFTFTTGSSTGTLSFDYSVSSQKSFDKLTITLDDTTLVNEVSGIYSSSCATILEANTTYVLTATYAKNNRMDHYDDQATISNIRVSNISGDISVSSTSYYPWTETTINAYPINTYSYYTFDPIERKYSLIEVNNVSSTNAINKYICSDTASMTCETMYKITGNNSGIINKVDVYTSALKSIRDFYNTASPGTGMPEDNVLAYYVWIPRYKYKVWNINKVIGTDSYNAQSTGIDIVFENGVTSTGTVSCNYNFAITDGSLSEICTGSNGDYYTHPAFWWDKDGDGVHDTGEEIEGFWMGKFALSSEAPDSGVTGGGNTTELTVRIIPKVSKWAGNNFSNYYKVIYDMQKSDNIYGLSTNRNNTDSHMLKNMEWGASAYLTNSKYGRCTDNVCEEVSRNNSGTTGVGPTGDINYINNTSATTTGNVYGIYDMSGGLLNSVMGYASIEAGGFTYDATSTNSNFTYSTSTAKYIDRYAYGATSTDQTAYNRSRLGDATGESVSWYSDNADFPINGNSWFARGGNNGNGITNYEGIFSFDNAFGGGAIVRWTSRAALVGF